MMTIKELKKLIEQLDDESFIFASSDNGMNFELVKLEIKNEGLGDYLNLKMERI